MTGLLGKFNDGGPIFTYTILIALVVVIILFAKAMISKGDNYKAIELIKSISWFAVAWGFLGRTFGLIIAFNMVEAAGELTPRLLAEGLKMALVDPLFGIFVFIIARIGILILIGLQKDFKPQD
ncbi:MAG: MotA/TolQ/ExbB proton channel family protein [Bacteroidota bacterium]